jgi:D-arabinose 1-dehydrogenase-like Zn-dependent alcohol dehydrogenase
MRAVVYDRVGELPVIRDLPEPECAPHGVVVRVTATGVCRSDWHAWVGHDAVALPHVPGHELAGVVERVGALVTRWKAGARVTVPFASACGSCPACVDGEHQVCLEQTQPGFTSYGSFAELVALDHADLNLVALPEEVDDVSAAALGCRFATAYRALLHVARVASGEWVSVHGCGGVGLSAVMIARATGARVIAVDVSPAALAWAGRLGAEHLVDAREPEVATRVRELSGGGAHVSVDALGSRRTLSDAVAGLRWRGRHVQVGLLLGEDALPPVDMGLVVSRELQLFGSHGMAAHAYPQMLAEIAAGAIRPERLVARVVDLEDAPAALAGMDAAGRHPGTVVVLPGGGSRAVSRAGLPRRR